jgi:hypothetical protein
MNKIDDLVLTNICKYFDTKTCKCKELVYLLYVSSYFREKISKLVTIQRHKVVLLADSKSKIRWCSNKICLTCNRVNDNEWEEIMNIKQRFSNVYNINSLKYLSYMNRDSSGIYIHRKTQQELESFIIKLIKVATNIVITRNYCCNGKGVEIDLA